LSPEIRPVDLQNLNRKVEYSIIKEMRIDDQGKRHYQSCSPNKHQNKPTLTA